MVRTVSGGATDIFRSPPLPSRAPCSYFPVMAAPFVFLFACRSPRCGYFGYDCTRSVRQPLPMNEREKKQSCISACMSSPPPVFVKKRVRTSSCFVFVMGFPSTEGFAAFHFCLGGGREGKKGGGRDCRPSPPLGVR
ncbi:unnamed protein product, partial [Ectocarpus sp. 12 AP-2014]